MTNEEMKPNRFGRWANARKLINKIQTTLRKNGVVIMATHLQSRQYDIRHSSMFKATKWGAYVLNGDRWECIDYCAFRFYKVSEKCE